MTAFATSADLIARYDSRTVGQLAADDGTEVAEGSMAANAKITAALNTATGKMKAALQRGARYTTAELEALTGESQAYLVDLTCAIAFWLLYRRRPYHDQEQHMEAKADAEEALEMLREGQNVFDISEKIDAGKGKIETVTRVTVINNYGLFSDRARGPFYPRRRSFRNR